MKNTKNIKLLIITGIILTGICVWYIWPDAAAVNDVPGDTAQGQEDQLNQEKPNEENKIDESGLKITEDLQNDIDAGYLILVNKTHGLDRDYKPEDLTGIRYYAADRSAEGRFMRAAAADAFHSMAEEARRQDIVFVMTTAYRSYGFQATLYNNYVANHGQAAADRFSARPGYSEHQTGLAVDVSAASVDYRLTREFSGTREGRWLSENAHLFGFIIRYQEGTEEITGYQYEPWHVRYVGLTAAEYIHTHGITLEEYLDKIK